MIQRTIRTAVLAAAAATALVATSAVPALASDEPATLADLPAGCAASLYIVTAETHLEDLTLNPSHAPGEAARRPAPAGSDAMGFMPGAIVGLGGSGDETQSRSSMLLVRPTDRHVMQVERRSRVGEPDRLEIIDSGETSTAPLAYADRFAYTTRTLQGTGTNPYGVLLRKTDNGWEQPGVWETGSTVVGSSRLFSSIEQLSATYEVYTDPTQTLFASTSKGQLLEITVSVDDPSIQAISVVDVAGFGDLTALTVSNCWSGDGRLFAGANDAGDIVAWFDADRTDGTSATDLVRIETGVALETGERAFGRG